MSKAPALLVHGDLEPLGALKRLLDAQSISNRRVHGCQEAAMELERLELPHLVFTDTHLPDGNWRDVLKLASKSAARAAVIVVSRFFEMRLYLDVIESGAADFVVPPFVPSELAYVVNCATERLVREGQS
jgi:DNA-binding response OmpR family regulator